MTASLLLSYPVQAMAAIPTLYLQCSPISNFWINGWRSSGMSYCGPQCNFLKPRDVSNVHYINPTQTFNTQLYTNMTCMQNAVQLGVWVRPDIAAHKSLRDSTHRFRQSAEHCSANIQFHCFQLQPCTPMHMLSGHLRRCAGSYWKLESNIDRAVGEFYPKNVKVPQSTLSWFVGNPDVLCGTPKFLTESLGVLPHMQSGFPDNLQGFLHFATVEA